MDILTYIKRMNQLYGSEQQVASLPFGTSGTYGALEEAPMPNIQDLIREEGVQVGPQVKDGGRIGFTPGGSADLEKEYYGSQKLDWMKNFPDLSWEEYLRYKSSGSFNRGGRVYDTRKYFSRGQLVQPGPGRPGYAGPDADKLIKAYSEEGAHSPIRREIKKSLLKNKQFKDFIGEKELKRVSNLDPSGPKGWTEKNLIKRFITYRKHMNMLPDKGKGYISAMKLADKLGVSETVFWGNQNSIKTDYPQYNVKKLNETLKGKTLTIDGNNFHYYKDPGKKEMKVLLEYFDRPILSKDTVKGLNAFFKDEAIMKMLDDRLFPDIEEAQRVLKAAKLPASEHNAATAMLRLGEVLQGKQFKNQIDIKGNKVLGNYIVKQLDDFGLFHPWSRGVYDAAVREISANVPKQVGSIEKYKTLLKGALPDGFLEKKNLNINEIFSVRASARNKAYPYAYFIDVIDKDLNQKELAAFHGNLSQAQTNLRNKIGQIRKTENPRFRKALYKEAQDIVKKFEGTRKVWKNTIKKNYPGKKFNLPNIVLGKEKEILAKDMKIAENIYKKAELDKWAAQNIDIAGHARKTGYVLTGADKGMLVTDIKTDVTKSLKNFINQMDQGKATLIANSLEKGKFKKICNDKLKAGKSVVCGVDFAEKYPKEYLRKVGAMEEVGKFFKTAKGLNIAKGVLNSAKYWTSPTTLGGGEAIYSTLAGWNEKTKGASWNESINEAMWFIPGKKARDVSELVGYEGHGYSPLFSTERHRLDATPEQQEMFEVMDLSLNIEKQKSLENDYYTKAAQIAEIEENIKKGTIFPGDADNLPFLKKQLEIIKKDFDRVAAEGENLFKTYQTGRQEAEGTTSLSEEQLYKPFTNLQTQAEQFIVDKYNKSLEDKYMQGDVGSGKVWSTIKEIAGTDPLSKIPWGKTAQEAAMLRSMDSKERYLYNIHARGLGHIRGPEDLTAQQWELALQDYPELQYVIPMRGVNYKQGGRVGFKLGGIDKGRRAFMKWLAGITGATVAGATGLLKWGKIGGKGTTAIKAGDKIIQDTPGMPDWYIPLINRIVKEGDNVTGKLSTVEREIVHTKNIAKGEDVTVYQNLDTGNVRVEYQSKHSEMPIQMEYRAPQVIDEGKYAGQKTNPEFSAVEAEPRWQQTAPDDADLTFEGENIVGRVEDLTTDTSKLKEFGKNKKLTIKEKIEAKKKQDYRKSLEHDSQTAADYLEGRHGPAPEPDVGMDEFGNLVDEYGEIID